MDAKQIPGEIEKRYGYTIRKGGTPDLKKEEPLALEEMKKIFKRHPAHSISNQLSSYDEFLSYIDDVKKSQDMKDVTLKLQSRVHEYLQKK